jgi:integrase
LIEKRRRRDRKGRAYTVYRVRWKDDAGRERSKTLPRGTKKDEVEDFERRVMTMKRAGALAQLDKGRQPLMEFVPEWWETYASPNLTRETLRRYAEVWNAHVLPRLGHYRLSELTPEVVSRFGAELQRAGVGANTRHKALTFLSGVLRTGVEWGRVPTNPVRDVRKPTVRRQRPVRPLSPEQVEALRGELDPVSASYVGVLAYAGPRPGEGLRLLWRDIGEQTLLFDVTKTRARFRPVRLLGPLRQDLGELRLQSGRPADGASVFPVPLRARHNFNNWRTRVFHPAAKRAGVPEDLVPYDLRHTFASLLIWEGRLSIVEIAAQMGHSPRMLLGTYTHVIAELSGQRMDIEAAIRRARDSSAAHKRPTRNAAG